MKLEIQSREEFKCEECGEGTEFIGINEHIKKRLCPYCAVEIIIEYVNAGHIH